MSRSADKGRARARSDAGKRNRTDTRQRGRRGSARGAAAQTHRGIVERYCEEVTDGTLVVGRLQRLAVERHLEDLQQAEARGFYFDEAIACEAIDFIERCCHHSKGEFAGQPLELTPCQRFIVWCVFGWRRQSDGCRRFKKAYLSMARKWGKSTFAAAVALLLLVFDHPIESGAEVYAVATKEAQARIVHDEAKRMVRQSPALRRRLRCLQRAIEYAATESTFQVIGSDSDGTDGQNLHGAILDELHAWRERHRGLHEKLTTAGGARRQPLWMTITTAGDERSLIWIEEEDYAIRCVESVVTGQIVDDTQFTFICRIDADDDPFDEGVWVKANPHIGTSVSLEYCREQALEAKGKPTARNKFLRYICNQQTTATERAIQPELWAAGSQPLSDWTGRTCFGAWDLGRADDWAAVALATAIEDDDAVRFEIRPHSWAARDGGQDLSHPQFAEWEAAGVLTICEGDAVEFDLIEQFVLETSGQLQVVSWAYDPTFSQQLAQRLHNNHGLAVFGFTQSARFYNEPIRTLLRLLAAGELVHGGDPCLSWQAGNLAIKRNNRDEWMPAKGGGPHKIDAMVATLMAISEAIYHRGQTDDSASVVIL